MVCYSKITTFFEYNDIGLEKLKNIANMLLSTCIDEYKLTLVRHELYHLPMNNICYRYTLFDKCHCKSHFITNIIREQINGDVTCYNIPIEEVVDYIYNSDTEETEKKQYFRSLIYNISEVSDTVHAILELYIDSFKKCKKSEFTNKE